MALFLLHIHILKNTNATIRDLIQDRGVVIVTEIVTYQEVNFVYHVER
jgi:hypothetical protein